MDPETESFVNLGLPFGPKARLVLLHINREAMLQGSPVVDVEKSMTAFISRIQRYAPNGQEIRKFKEQLSRLSAAMIRLAVIEGSRAVQVDTKIVTVPRPKGRGFPLHQEHY